MLQLSEGGGRRLQGSLGHSKRYPALDCFGTIQKKCEHNRYLSGELYAAYEYMRRSDVGYRVSAVILLERFLPEVPTNRQKVRIW